MKDSPAPISQDQILLVGLNHRQAAVEVREKLAFRPERLNSTLSDLANILSIEACELVLLSTCNRTEIYAFSDDPPKTLQRVLHFLAEHSQLNPEILQPLCYSLTGQPAIQHLLEVASGLDSLVIGEHEILGQVKDAFEAAQKANTCGAVLSALFRTALQTGKRVRSETEIGRTSLSIATVVVELAQEKLGALQGRTALLIGAGKISSMTARALTNAGLSCILIANRTFERAQKLAHALAGRAVHFEMLPQSLLESDIVICSTGAPHIVLHAESVRRAMAARPDRPLLVADLAVPRDADPQIADITGVYLADIDDLDQLVQDRHPLAAATHRRAEEIVLEELEAYKTWIKSRRSADLICALNRYANAIVETQLQKTARKLGDLTPQQEQAIEKMAQAIASQLLHEPIRRIKTASEDANDQAMRDLIRELFKIA